MMRYSGTTADLDRTLMAIADPVRRRILERVGHTETRVTTIASEFPISLNSVSKHLKILERAQLIERRVAGREHFFRVRLEPLEAAHEWIQAQQRFWSSRLAAIDDVLRAEDSREAKPAGGRKKWPRRSRSKRLKPR